MKGVPYSNAGVLEATWAHRGRHSRINIQWKRPLQDSTGIGCSLFSRIAKASPHFQTDQILLPHAPHFALRLAQFPTKFTLHSPYSSSSLNVSEDWRKFLQSIHKSIGLQLYKNMGDAMFFAFHCMHTIKFPYPPNRVAAPNCFWKTCYLSNCINNWVSTG